MTYTIALRINKIAERGIQTLEPLSIPVCPAAISTNAKNAKPIEDGKINLNLSIGSAFQMSWLKSVEPFILWVRIPQNMQNLCHIMKRADQIEPAC
jgi:hypothetical protein